MGIALVLWCISCIGAFQLTSASTLPHNDNDWDFIAFTQNWIKTACLQWELESSANSCALPTDKEQWLIHGAWPTRTGTYLPSSCNDSWVFDENEVRDILPDLQTNWLSVHNVPDGNEDFWSHEWSKHGTCAASVDALSSQRKFFGQVLNWKTQYDLKSILSEAGIDVGGKYAPTDVWEGIASVLGKNPILECFTYDGTTYMFQIQICFDKSLSLIDCKGKSGSSESNLINCNNKPSVLYS